MDIAIDGTTFACASVDKGLKVFDVINFDMINMFKLNHLPNSIAWIYQKGAPLSLIAW